LTTKLSAVGIKDVDFGADVTVIEPVNLYGCVIGFSTMMCLP